MTDTVRTEPPAASAPWKCIPMDQTSEKETDDLIEYLVNSIRDIDDPAGRDEAVGDAVIRHTHDVQVAVLRGVAQHLRWLGMDEAAEALDELIYDAEPDPIAEGVCFAGCGAPGGVAEWHGE